MLIISRKVNESVVIGDGIVVTVIEIRGDKVRLGVAAPNEISVHRREVYEAIRRFDFAPKRPPPEPPPWRPDLNRG